MDKNINSVTINNNQSVESTQINIDSKINLRFINRIVQTHKGNETNKNHTSDSHRTYTEQKRPDTKEHVLCG